MQILLQDYVLHNKITKRQNFTTKDLKAVYQKKKTKISENEAILLVIATIFFAPIK